MITRTWGRLASSIAMFSAFVITFRGWKSEALIWRAISTVVVPESRMIVSPSRIIFSAAWAMRAFSAWCSVSLIVMGSSRASMRFRAPPWERTTAPAAARASRSPRIVTAETPKRPTSSSTVTRSWGSRISRIRRLLSSTRRRDGFCFDIGSAPHPACAGVRLQHFQDLVPDQVPGRRLEPPPAHGIVLDRQVLTDQGQRQRSLPEVSEQPGERRLGVGLRPVIPDAVAEAEAARQAKRVGVAAVVALPVGGMLLHHVLHRVADS